MSSSTMRFLFPLGALLLAACSGSRADFDPQVRVTSFERVAPNEVHFSACFRLPSEADWVLGRLPGDVFLSGPSGEIPLTRFELVGLSPTSDSELTLRCDVLAFSTASVILPGEYTITIERLAASLPQEPHWDELQRSLDEAGTGIVIAPLPGEEGLSFALLQRPAGLTDLEAHDIVVGMAQPVALRPWVVPVFLED